MNLTSSAYTDFATAARGTVVFAGNNTGYNGAITLGNLTAVTFQGNTAMGNGASLTLGAGQTMNYLFDGNGSGQAETISTGDFINLTGAATIAVNRLGTTYAPLFTTALNKTASFSTLTTNGNGLTITNTSQYGVLFTGQTTLSGAESFTVANATASNINPGLTLAGKVTGTTTGITKAGAGTMLLSDATSDFTGNLTVTAGVLGTTSDGALGNLANTITLNGASGAFEAFDTFSTARSFTFSNATNSNNLLLVAQGKTLTITSALSGANGFQKGDSGVLKLTSNASTISGAIVASGGILRITDAAALGTTSGLSVAANEGTAFQLDGSGGAINFARPITINSSGVQNNGSIENFAGSNTVSSAVTLGAAATIGNSAVGTTLNLTGGVSGAFGLTFNGVGDVNVSTTAIGAVTGISRNGSGATNISVANPLFVSAMAANGGRLLLSGAGTVGTAAVATTVTSGGSFVLDNSGTAVSFRLNSAGAASTRTMNLSSGTFQFIGGATAVTESLGALTSTWGGNTIRLDPGAGSSTVTFASLAANVVNGGSTLVFQSGATGSSSTFGAANSQVVFTTAPTLTNGIISRAVVFDNTGGTPSYNFATHAAGTGIAAYTAYTANNLNTSAATDNVRLTANVSLSSSTRTVNSLVLSGNTTANAAGFGTLTLTSGNILVQSGTAAIGSNLVVAAGATEFGINVAPGAVLNINAPLTSSNNVTTGLGGTINLNTRQYANTGANSLTMNGGTIKLAGGDNTLYPGQTTGANQNLAVGPGATLDLNGNVQVAGDLRSPNNNAFFGSGGTVTSTGGAATIVSRQANANWGGVISGPITYVMGNTTLGNVERFYQDNTYTGRTLVMGGYLEVTDAGRLSGTTAIDLQYGTLNITNGSGNNGRFNLTDRINDAAPITMRGGEIRFVGRAQSASSETVGAVTLARGNSNILLSAGGTGINSAELTFTTLTQGSIDATTNVQNASGQLGSANRLFFGNGAALVVNNALPAWIQSGGTEFMTYVPNLGAMALSANGSPGYTGTTLPTVNSLATAVGNYRIGASGAVPTGGLTVNTLNINGAFNVTFAAVNDVLNIGSGGLMKSGTTGTAIGATGLEGRLTAGGASPTGTVPLYLYNGVNGTSFTINSQIVDNGSSPVRLVISNFNGGTTAITNANNNYTGGTVVNGWVAGTGGGLTVTGSGIIPAGGLSINGSTVTTTAAGQIAAANTVTLARAVR
ncbi:MAG: hypothetical protein QM811_31605 [Pirellulales bacterium]